MSPQLKRALEYISNSGGSPSIDQFDEDHEPVGPDLREQLKDAQLVYERDGRIRECPPNGLLHAGGDVDALKLKPGARRSMAKPKKGTRP